MTALTLTLTDAGRVAMVDPTGGTRAVLITEAGLTEATFVHATTLTSLPGEFKRIDSVAGKAIDAKTVHLVMRDESEDAYTVRGIGLYLSDGTLFAFYGQDEAILGKADVSTFYLAADIHFPPGDAINVQFGNTNFLNPPASESTKGVAFLASIVEALAGAVADKIITPATLAVVLDTYVREDVLGIAGGVAQLGADGKLLASQRPPIDLIDVFAVESEAAMLALAATVGDIAVRSDTSLLYILQAQPASVLSNWIQLNTPAPVQSVNGKVGAIVLGAADVGAVPIARRITASGIATGGGTLDGDREINVPAASAAEAEAGAIGNKALTPASIAGILGMIGGKVSPGRRIDGGGLVTGGGTLEADRTLNAMTLNRPRKTLATAKQQGRPSDVGRFLRIEDVIATTGLSRATIYRLLAADDFPPKVALTTRCVGWWEAEVRDWVGQRLARAGKAT